MTDSTLFGVGILPDSRTRKALIEFQSRNPSLQGVRLGVYGEPHLTLWQGATSQIFQSYNVEVLVLHERGHASPHEELMKDFMSLIASFSGKFYRLRGHEQQRALLADAQKRLP